MKLQIIPIVTSIGNFLFSFCPQVSYQILPFVKTSCCSLEDGVNIFQLNISQTHETVLKLQPALPQGLLQSWHPIYGDTLDFSNSR